MTSIHPSIVPPPAEKIVKTGEPMIVQLGRYGDIINILPFVFSLFKKTGQPVEWLVGGEHADILEGVSYVKPIVWNGSQDTLQQAILAHRRRNLIVTQAWQNPDQQHLTSSFSLEQWRHAGALDEKGKWPLLYPNENYRYDYIFAASEKTRPKVLVATRSISTPYRYADRLIAMIRGLDVDVVDLDEIKLKRIWDLIGIYDNADCLVTVDTVHLHLARASNCPVVALINDGWRGAVPPPQTVASWRYAELGSDLVPVVEAVKKQIERKADSLALVIHTFNPVEDRHKRAMATHPKDSICVRFDHRPKVKELLAKGLEANKDVVAFTNDDTSIPVGSIEKILSHAQKCDFGCSRRPRDPVHIGREIFWFRSDWLKKNWAQVPECYWTVQKPDLILVRWMRRLRGIPSTMENLQYDFSPVELPAGLIEHEDHPSHWDTPEITNSPEGQFNEKLWREDR